MNSAFGSEVSPLALELLLLERHSCRGYLPQSVPETTILKMLDLAQKTASWCNTQPWQLVLTSGEGTERFRFFGAPHVATIITTPESLGVYGAIDYGAYANNLMLAAQSCGVASIGPAALASQANFIRNNFKIHADRQVVCGISFGYKDDAHPANGFRMDRDDASSAVTWVYS